MNNEMLSSFSLEKYPSSVFKLSNKKSLLFFNQMQSQNGGPVKHVFLVGFVLRRHENISWDLLLQC